MKNPLHLPLVLIEWHDAESNEQWATKEDLDGSCPLCISVGWLYQQSASHLTLFTSYDHENESYSGILKIPSPWSSITTLLDPKE